MEKKSNAMDLSGLDQKGKIIAEYIWLDGSLAMRGKARTLNKRPESVADLPEWNFDGSSCYMAPTENSEVIIKPVAFFPDPFRGGDNIIVLTETFVWEDTTYKNLVPARTNFRNMAKKIFDALPDEEPWFGIEQEYTLLTNHDKFNTHPYGWPTAGYPGPQGPYYCSVGGNVCFGRAVSDAHYKACLYAGITISGTNAEVMPGQWEYQIGPCTGIDSGDHMTVSRYLLQRVGEEHGLVVSYDPKIFREWNGSGCHTNFSTATMRAGTGGMKYIDDMMACFKEKHALHISLYGSGNDKRLTGEHETSSCDTFSYGCGNRAASFRIPTQTMHDNGKGYVEDRRPASNIDPYIVSAAMYDTGVLVPSGKGEGIGQKMFDHYHSWDKWIQSIVVATP
jgi:glutamine synthetase